MHSSTRTRWCYATVATNSSGKMGDSMPGCNRDDEGNIVYQKIKKQVSFGIQGFTKTLESKC